MRANFLAYALPLLLSAAATAAPVTSPKSLEGRWIVAELGASEHLRKAELPYEVDFAPSDVNDFPEDAQFNVVRMSLRAWAGSGCGFEVRDSTLVGTKVIGYPPDGPHVLCTSKMDGGGIEWHDLCHEKAEPDHCMEAARKDGAVLETFFLQGNDLSWRRAKGRLILYSPSDDTEVVLVPNPLS